MNVSFSCPRCEGRTRQEVSNPVGSSALCCEHCQFTIPIAADAIQQGALQRCLVCPSQDLFWRKDFPQRLGVAIVIAGFAASCVAWYHYEVWLTFGILFATALADVTLYFLMPDSLACYRCGAEYRHAVAVEHGKFDLEVHERHRQAAARLQQRQSAGSGSNAGG